jgi:hypothetical protein
MPMWLSVVAGLAFVISVPYWLPRSVIALRMRIFTGINGEEGIPIPGALVDASRFKSVYSHRAAHGRSRGAALSDLFWYWLSPGPEIHQEHIEPGERYDEVARATHRILALPKPAVEELTSRTLRRVMDEWDVRNVKRVRLRDLMMPVWAEFYYEIVFGETCPRAARAFIVANANDVVTALKCCSLRHMSRRHRLTRFLIDKLKAGAVPHALPECLSPEERAFYLQGVFFNTAVVQMSEAMTHLLLLIAQHDAVQTKLASRPEDEDYLDRVINEALRVFPLFGISHRITSEAIAVDGHTALPTGSVLCFNHQEFHRHGLDDPDRFDPDRWENLSPREANFIPFGVGANRPCPAQAIALSSMRVAVREILRRFRLRSSVRHTRSIPNRGPCLLAVRVDPRARRRETAMLLWMRMRDRWEDVGRSVVQLIFGTYMVWDARRQRLCQRYFETHDPSGGSQSRNLETRAGVCPFTGRKSAS